MLLRWHGRKDASKQKRESPFKPSSVRRREPGSARGSSRGRKRRKRPRQCQPTIPSPPLLAGPVMIQLPLLRRLRPWMLMAKAKQPEQRLKILLVPRRRFLSLRALLQVRPRAVTTRRRPMEYLPPKKQTRPLLEQAKMPNPTKKE